MSPATAASSSPTSSTTTSSAAAPAVHDPNPNANTINSSSPTRTWWESIARARSSIESLAAAVPSFDPSPLLDSDRPAHSLLSSAAAYAAVSAALFNSSAGSGADLLCQWLYDSLQSSDSDLKLPAISYLPLLAGIYLSKIISNSSTTAPSLAGFEAVLLAVYSSEARSRGGRPLLVSIPDLSQPSLYHHPIKQSPSNSSLSAPSVGVISPPLEPQSAVKSTKRACIVGVALDRYYKDISVMPPQSKIDFCEFAAAWAGQDCPCRFEFDHCKDSSEKSDFGDGEIDVAESVGRMSIGNNSNNGHCGLEGGIEEEGKTRRGERVPLPWELMQPMLRILGHCLLGPLNPQEVKDAASEAVRCVHARAVHELMPQAILAARSLIQLDKSSRMATKAAVLTSMSNAGTGSNPDTPSKSRKPEVLLASK